MVDFVATMPAEQWLPDCNQLDLWLLLYSYVAAGSNGTTWDKVGDTGPDAGDSFSPLPFYTSGVNADFVTVNGAYQPVISMEVSFAVFAFFSVVSVPSA